MDNNNLFGMSAEFWAEAAALAAADEAAALAAASASIDAWITSGFNEELNPFGAEDDGRWDDPEWVESRAEMAEVEAFISAYGRAGYGGDR